MTHTFGIQGRLGEQSSAFLAVTLAFFCGMAAWAAPANENSSSPVIIGTDAFKGNPSAAFPVAPPIIRFRVGDGPNWKDPDFKDDDWSRTDSFAYPQDGIPTSSPPTVPVWFRFPLSFPPEAAGVPLVLQARPFQFDLKVFLNGKRVAGPQDLDPSTGITPRCIVPTQTDNVVALRWVPNKSRPNIATTQGNLAAFSLAFLDSERVLANFDRRERLERSYSWHRIALMAVFVVFFLFHLSLYRNYPLRRENLYCCATALLCALALASLHLSEVYHYDRGVWHIAYIHFFLAFMPLSIVSGLGLFQLVFAGRFRWTLYLYLVLGLLAYLAALRVGNAPVHLFPVLLVPELIWVILPGRRRKPLLLGWPVALITVAMASVMLAGVASFYKLDTESGLLRYAPWYFFAVFLQFVSFVFAREYADAQRRINVLAASLEQKVEERTRELKAAAAEIKTLQGILPICMYCHRIRDDHESWQQLELYLKEHSDAEFSHGLCPECLKEHYPETGEGQLTVDS